MCCDRWRVYHFHTIFSSPDEATNTAVERATTSNINTANTNTTTTTYSNNNSILISFPYSLTFTRTAGKRKFFQSWTWYYCHLFRGKTKFQGKFFFEFCIYVFFCVWMRKIGRGKGRGGGRKGESVFFIVSFPRLVFVDSWLRCPLLWETERRRRLRWRQDLGQWSKKR